ncbi:hypothetical protein A2U01_0109238, partial [Trifolium medium]|nr:hypothetical protein [Trifolium medium]
MQIPVNLIIVIVLVDNVASPQAQAEAQSYSGK